MSKNIALWTTPITINCGVRTNLRTVRPAIATVDVKSELPDPLAAADERAEGLLALVMVAVMTRFLRVSMLWQELIGWRCGRRGRGRPRRGWAGVGRCRRR